MRNVLPMSILLAKAVATKTTNTKKSLFSQKYSLNVIMFRTNGELPMKACHKGMNYVILQHKKCKMVKQNLYEESTEPYG